MPRAAILGLGLMGGSLGLALRGRGWSVAGHGRREAARREALAAGAADEVFPDPADACRDADLVVVCVPVRQIDDVLRAADAGLGPHSVVTDVGSTKTAVCRGMIEALAGTGARAVGSHPIAGSERQGLAAARADLYEGAVVVVTPDEDSDPEAVERVVAMWTTVGAQVVRCSPSEHDALLARTSHLPHLASALTALAVARGRSPGDLTRFCGPGFRDTTRVAAGSPVIWRDIVATNLEAIRSSLDDLQTELEDLRNLLDQGDPVRIEGWLDQARQARQDLCPPGPDAGGGTEE